MASSTIALRWSLLAALAAFALEVRARAASEGGGAEGFGAMCRERA